jgi:hypothetical protein
MRHAVLIGITLAAAACVSAPPCAHAGATGTVHANTPELAAAVAGLMDEFAARLRRELPATRDEPLSVWVQERPQAPWGARSDEHIVAFRHHWTNRIHLTEGSPTLAQDLAHELVHALADDSWDAVPPALMEGFCDRIAVRIAPPGESLHAGRLLLAAEALGGPRLLIRMRTGGGFDTGAVHLSAATSPVTDPAMVFDRSSAAVDAFADTAHKGGLYGLGYLAAGRLLERAGLAETHARLIEAAQQPEPVATAQLAEAAGLAGGRAAWQAALGDELERDLATVATGIADRIVDGVRQWAAGRGAADSRAAIEAADPELRIEGRKSAVRLLALPAFVAQL